MLRESIECGVEFLDVYYGECWVYEVKICYLDMSDESASIRGQLGMKWSVDDVMDVRRGFDVDMKSCAKVYMSASVDDRGDIRGAIELAYKNLTDAWIEMIVKLRDERHLR